jgi:hypothetical protein
MAILNTGKSFASGEQLTADKLNLMISGATFNVGGAVDNATLTVNSGGALAVNQITSSNIPNNAITTSDLAQLGNNQFLGRTSSGTGDVESVDISAIANLLRPKFVTATEGTDQGSTGGSAGAGNALLRQLSNPTGDTSFVYDLEDFRSADSDFNADGAALGYKKIVGVYVKAFVQTKKNITYISCTVPGDTLRTIVKMRTAYDAASGTPANEAQALAYLPINPGQSTFEVKHFRNTDSNQGSLSTEHEIIGFDIIPKLPVS